MICKPGCSAFTRQAAIMPPRARPERRMGRGLRSTDPRQRQACLAIRAAFARRQIADSDARILDAGCGTVNMAQLFRTYPYSQQEANAPAGVELTNNCRERPKQRTWPRCVPALC